MKKGEVQKTPIRWARYSTHQTQQELAAKCGMSQARLSGIERGFTKATPDEQVDIAECVGLKPTDLDFSLRYDNEAE